MNKWRSRIVGHDRVDPESLTGHPLNFRTHPMEQRAVVRDSIAELGFVKSVIVNKRTGYIIDGHERVWQALDAKQHDPDVLIDVEYVDVGDDEEKLMLTVLDPSSELANVDEQKLDQLLSDAPAPDSEHIVQMIADLKMSVQLESVLGDGYDVEPVPSEKTHTITFTFGESDYETIKSKLDSMDGTREQILWRLVMA